MSATLKSREKVDNKPEHTTATADKSPQKSPTAGFTLTGFQHYAGNLAIQRAFQSGAIQLESTVSRSSDPSEHEATKTAERITSSPAIDSTNEHDGRKKSPHTSADHSHVLSSMSLGSGQPLSRSNRAFFEPRFGEDFSDVRVHSDERAAESAATLGANAFTTGRDIVFGGGRFNPDDSKGKQTLAHELTHVVQQRNRPSHGPPLIQRDPQKTEPLTDQQAQALTQDELTRTEDRLLTQLAAGGSADSRNTLETNLGVVQRDLTRRGLPVKPYWGVRTASSPAELATKGQIAALQVKIDLLIATIENSFKSISAATITRLQEERKKIEGIHKDDVLREGDRLEASRVAVDSLANVQKGLPATAPKGLENPYAEVQKKIAAAISDLGTLQQATRLAETKKAAEQYIDAFSKSIFERAQETYTKLQLTPADFPDSNPFINGYSRDGVIHLTSSLNELATYKFVRGETLEDFKKLGNLTALATGSYEDRSKFLKQLGDSLDHRVKLGQGLIVMASGFQIGCGLMQMVAEATDQVVWSDIANAKELREKVIVPLDQAITVRPSIELIATTQAVVNRLYDTVKTREGEIKKYLENVGTFMQLATLVVGLYGGVAAMEAAGGSGVTVGVAGTPQIALGQFVRGSLAFTMGSTMVTTLLTGQAPTPLGFVQQAVTDLATLGLLHGVGFGLAGKFGGVQNVPVALQMTAQFSALWAWSSAISLINQKDPITATSAIKTIAESGTHTAIAMIALGVGHKVGSLPEIKLTTPPAPDVAAKQQAALSEFEVVRERGKTIQTEIENWGKSGQQPGEVEPLMRNAESWYGTLRTSIKGLLDAGVLDAKQAEALTNQTATHISQLRNVRDMGRLGIRETGESSIAFSGDVRNLDAFLGRLKRQESIQSYAPIGRSGIYKVVGVDNSVSFYYPEGPAPESARGMNLIAEALAENYPNLDANVRTSASTILGTLPAAEATRVALELTGPGGEAVLGWMAELAGRGTPPGFISSDLILEFSRSTQLLDSIKAERPADLEIWYKSQFEKSELGGDRTGRFFLNFLGEVRARRGTLQISGAAEASSVVNELAAATTTFPVTRQAAYHAQGARIRRTPADWVDTQRHLGGEFRETGIDQTTWIFQMRDGTIIRAWVWENENVSAPVDVAGTLKTLRDGLAIADAATDPAQKNAAIEALKPYADRIMFMRRLRGLDIAEALKMLERIKPGQRPTTVETTKPVEAAAPEPELVPVTTRDLYITRRSQLIERANRQGATNDPLIQNLISWNPRTGANAPSNPTATLDLIERQLNAKSAAAVARYKTVFGAGNMAKVQREAFGGRADYGDYLASLLGKHGISLEAVRGLGFMTDTPVGQPTIPIAQLLDMAPTAAQRNFVLTHFEQIRNIPGAHQLLADMAKSKNAFRGGYWTLQAIERGHIKIDDIIAFEQKETLTAEQTGAEKDIVRVYDVVLKGNRRLEMKSWTRWFPSSIRSQFGRDVRIITNQFTDLDALGHVTWLFEGTPGMTEMTPDGPRFNRMTEAQAREAIGEQMKNGLEDAMAAQNIAEDARGPIRARLQALLKDIIKIDTSGASPK